MGAAMTTKPAVRGERKASIAYKIVERFRTTRSADTPWWFRDAEALRRDGDVVRQDAARAWHTVKPVK